MQRAVHLHGRLGTKFGKRFDLEVGSAAEAVRALAFQLPGFADYIRQRRYVVSVGEGGTVIGEQQLPMRLGRQRDIHITPAGMVSGIETILLGGILLATAVAAVAVLSMPKMPPAASREEATKTASFVFDGPVNVQEQGHPVPLIYGRFRGGSVVVSAGIATTDVNQASISRNPANPNYGGGAYTGYVGAGPGISGSDHGREWSETQLAKGGKGGGGGQQRSAQEDPNTLQSQATAKVLDLISEGEIVGLVDGMKSVYFDETPLQNPDGSFNFAGVAIEQRFGLPDQDFIPGFAQTENSVAIDTRVAIATGPVTRSIVDEDVTVARVTIRLPQLYKQDTSNGDLKASSVSVKISVQADGGGFTDVTTMDFVGKTNSGYQRSVDIRLPNGVQRDIRVTRITADAAVASLANETHWELLTEIVEAKLSYPDSALVGLTVDARQFGSSIPTRSYDVKGLIIEVPTNYDPETRAYVGIWDGTFKRAWTDNPAWVLRDIIVNRRYGLGARVPPSAVDIWGLYAIAQYCDGMVPDGFGGERPRYTINCCIHNPASAYDVIAAIASVFRGWAYWGSGAIIAAQDRPEDPSILITPSNVVDGKISYGRVTPVERRRSVAVVYWNDPEDGFRLNPEIVEDADLIRRFGRRAGDEVTAFGVTNRGQANMMARWVLEDERPSSNTTAVYEVGDDHGFVEPGRVAQIADRMFTQNRRGGRVKASTVAGITLDAPFTFVGGQAYQLRVMLPNGTVSIRPITNLPGTTDGVTLGGANWDNAPNAGSVWTIESDQVVNRQFRVRAIGTDEPPYQVQAVLHDPTKYDRVEFDRDIATPNFLDLPVGPLQPPGTIDAFEFLLQDGNAAIPSVQISWLPSPDPRVTFYQAQFRRPLGSYEPLGDGIETSRVVRGTEPGQWGVRVRALDSLGRKTQWIEALFDLDGQVDALPNVTGLSVVRDDASLQSMIAWVKPVDQRPLLFEVLYDAAGVFGNALQLGVVDAQEYVVSAVGTYWVRSWFMASASVAPPSVVVQADDLPAVQWGNVDGRPLDLGDLDPAALVSLDQLLIDVDDLQETYGDTAGAAASAAAADLARQAAEQAESDALAHATMAGGHSSAASASAIAAKNQVIKQLPSTFDEGGAYFTFNMGSPPSNRPPLDPAQPGLSFPVVPGVGKVLQVTNFSAPLAPIGLLRLEAGNSYEVSARIRDVGSYTTTPSYIGMLFFDGDGNPLGQNYSAKGGGVTPAAFTTYSATLTTEEIRASLPTAAYIGGLMYLNYWEPGWGPFPAGVIGQVEFFRVREVTAREAAEAAAIVSQAQAVIATDEAAAAAASESLSATYAGNAAASAGAAASSHTAAATSASAAEGSNVSASGHAASAQSSATLTAQLSGGAINRNALFSDYPGSIPVAWNVYDASAWNSRIARPDGSGGWAVRFDPPDGSAHAGLYQVFPVQALAWYVIEADIKMVYGSPRGAGVHYNFYNDALASTGYWNMSFFDEPNVSGSAMLDTDHTGRFVRWRKLVQAPVGSTQVYLYAMGQWSGFGHGLYGKGIIFERLAMRPASEAERLAKTALPDLQADVTEQAGAIATLEGRTLAFWQLEVNAGSGATAFMAARAETSPGVVSSDISMGARELHIYNPVGAEWKKALSIVGGNATFTGSLNVGVSIRLGSGAGWPVALQSRDFSVSDGTVVSFEADLGGLPALSFAGNNLVALAAGETYSLYADSLTSTGFTARLRIITPAAPANYNLTVDTVPGTGPTRQIDKAANPDSPDGNYSFTIGVTQIVRVFEPPDEPAEYSFSATVGVWVKKAGVWTKATQVTSEGGSTTGTGGGGQNYNESRSFSRTVQLGTGVEAFGITLDVFTPSGGLHNSCSLNNLDVAWQGTGTPGSTRSATPAGQLSTVTVRPQ